VIPVLAEPVSLPPSPSPPSTPQPADDHVSHFVPLRTDPPPRLFATWWLRYMLFLAQLVALAVVVLQAYRTLPSEVLREPLVVVAHGLAALLLVSWSGLAMADAARLVPATRYHPKSNPWLAVLLWLVAFVAPSLAFEVVDWARVRFADDADDAMAVAIAALAVAVTFLLVWLPFQYHTRQAHRIGAPGRVVAAWFWVPLSAAVGVLAINALGLHERLAEDGFTDRDRVIQAAIVYGLPALTFTLSTWRATTVFDEVIELRWLRWKTEWEQTLAAMAAQPAPGPEIAPTVPRE
jgi:hypothetical protein